MCGGSTQTTQQVTIPPEVLARYNDVNARAEQVANTPFKPYSNDPSAFVAPLTATQQAGVAGTNAAAGQAQPYYDAATGQLLGAQAGAMPWFTQSGSDINAGQAIGANLNQASLDSLLQASANADPLQQKAARNIGQGLAAAQPWNQQAAQQYYAGLGAAQPLNEAANENISGALSGAQPYQDLATGLGLAGARAVNPDALTGSSINQYLSPYLSTVLGSTAALLDQQNQQQQSGQLGTAIKSGAFGGDRAGIAAANLAQQQNLANSKIFSDILNQGYGQALSTAQQQQQLGLSAEQANRAAQAAASGQLLAVGQQGFGQGLSAAQAQQGLGQTEYGQYSGAGQNLAGLGNQIYSQNTGTGQAQAGLAQQLFGQGLATSQQEAALSQQAFAQQLAAAQAKQGLGQGIYGLGSQTSQQLAGLGTGAQGAALQGAQAQLAAGQTQQQTEQAGLQALYNQFLQQQSYPFQVAQFLANIAEGTGALSGSTTTTTQPGGFFSDRRLKDDVREVGRTFDGQPIVTYRYKGEPETRMGLIAQDVEKVHPKAVGLAAGYRTVDYKKATDAAAKRGHFAEGGVAGFDPALMQQILANSAGMYGPYLTPLGGAIYGGSSRVPAANLPVGSLKTAGDLPKARSPFDQAKEIADFGTTLSDDADEAKKLWDKLDKKHARGGVAGFADGGMPYSNQVDGPSLDIPNDRPDLNRLPKPGQIPGQESGLHKAKDAVQTALAVAKLAAMFADGGAVSDQPATNDNTEDTLDRLMRAVRGVESGSASGNYTARGPTTRRGSQGLGAYQVMSDNVGPWGREVLGRELTPDEFLASRDYQDQIARAKLGQAYKRYGTTDDAASVWFSGRPMAQAGSRRDQLGTTVPDYVAKVRKNMGLAAATQPPIEVAATVPEGLAGGDASDTLGPAPAATADAPASSAPAGPEPHKSFWSKLTEKQNLIPILDFIAAAGTAPTVHPGVALAAGLRGAAQGLVGQQAMDIRSREAQAEILQKTMGLAGSRFVPLKTNPDGAHVWRDTVIGDQINDNERIRRITSMGGMAPLVQSAAASGSASTPAATVAGAPSSAAAAPGATPTGKPQAAPTTTPKAAQPAPKTASEAVYERYDSNPRVQGLRQQYERFQAEADEALRQASDPLLIGTPVAEQALQRANNAREQAQQALTQWQTLREQLAKPEIETLTEAKKRTFALQSDAKTEAYTRALDAQNALAQSRALMGQLIDPKTGKPNINGGPLGPVLARAAQMMVQSGRVSPELAQAITGTNPNDAAAVEKLRTMMGSEIARQELSGSPIRVSEFQQFLRTTPGVDLPAAASVWILKNIVQPKAQGAINLYGKVRDMDPLKDDIRGATYDFWRANPWYQPTPAEETAADKAGAPPVKLKPLPKNASGQLLPKSPTDLAGYPSGTAFIIPAGPNKGKIGRVP